MLVPYSPILKKMKENKIIKAVIPAAGLGTRLYPISRVIPKEMFPIGNRSVIEYIILEGILSGCTKFCIIISKGKEVIKDYLTYFADEKFFDLDLGDQFKRPEFEFVYQDKPTGLGDAMLLAREFTGEDTFAILLPDNLFPDYPPATGQMIDAYFKYGCSILGTSEISEEHEAMFEGSGRFEYEKHGDESELKITRIYDKSMKLAKSSKGERFKYRGRGRYILTSSIYEHLELKRPNNPEDYDEISAVRSLLGEEMMIAKIIQGRTFDTGTASGYKHAIYNMGEPLTNVNFYKK